MPNPTLIAATDNNAAISSGTSATVSSVGSVTAGNLMIVVMMVGGSTLPASFTAPDGTWTSFLATTSNQSSSPLVATAIFYKQATGSGAFSGSFGWTNTATSGHWMFMEWSGAGAGLVDGTVATSVNASGTKTSPSKTPGAGNVNDTLVCGIFAGIVGTDSLTIPGGMSSIVNVAGTSAIPFFALASLPLASASATGTKTWTIPTSRACLGVSFLIQQGPVWDFETIPTGNPPLSYGGGPPHLNRYAGIRQRSEFAIYTPWINDGWEISPPQPPRPRRERAGAMMVGDQGIYAGMAAVPLTPRVIDQTTLKLKRPVNSRYSGAMTRGAGFAFYTPWQVMGWEIQPPQPQHPRPEKSGAVAIGDQGDENAFTPPAPPPPMGWEVSPPQPPRPRRVEGLLDDGDAGTESLFAKFFPDGWEPILPPPRWPGSPGGPAPGRSPETGDQGIYAAFAPFFNFGREMPPVVRYRTPKERRGAFLRGDDGTQAKFLNFFPDGWEATLHQPQHPRPERAAAIARGDEGDEYPLISFFPVGYDVLAQVWQRPFKERRAAIMKGDDGTQAVKTNFFPLGWEPVLPLIRWVGLPGGSAPGRSPEFGDQGTAATFTAKFILGWDVQNWQPPAVPKWLARRAPGLKGKSEFGIYTPAFVEGWSIVLPPAWRPKWERGAAAMRGDDGDEAPYAFVPPPFVPAPLQADSAPAVARTWLRGAAVRTLDEGDYFPLVVPFPEGWAVQSWQPPHPIPERRAAGTMRGDDGSEAAFSLWHNAGWEVQPPQPPHPVPEKRAAATMRGNDGAEARFIAFFPDGWEIQPWQPRFVRRFDLDDGDRGIEQIFFVPPIPLTQGWWVDPPMIRHPRPERAGATAIGDGGIEGQKVAFVADGWEIAGPMLRHWPRKLYQDPGDAGIEAKFVPTPAFTVFGWDVQAVQPPHLAPERRAAATMRGDDGNEFSFVPPQVPSVFGWEQAPPTHRRPARLMQCETWDPGIESPFVPPVSPPPFGWGADQQQIRHVIRAAAIFPRGDDGLLVAPASPPVGWIDATLLPTPVFRPTRYGAVARGDDGIYAAYSRPNAGWNVPFVHLSPPSRRSIRFAGLARGDDGAEFPEIRFRPYGWEIPSPQPPRFSRARGAGFLMGPLTVDGVFPWHNVGWDFVEAKPVIRPRRRDFDYGPDAGGYPFHPAPPLPTFLTPMPEIWWRRQRFMPEPFVGYLGVPPSIFTTFVRVALTVLHGDVVSAIRTGSVVMTVEHGDVIATVSGFYGSTVGLPPTK